MSIPTCRGADGKSCDCGFTREELIDKNNDHLRDEKYHCRECEHKVSHHSSSSQLYSSSSPAFSDGLKIVIEKVDSLALNVKSLGVKIEETEEIQVKMQQTLEKNDQSQVKMQQTLEKNDQSLQLLVQPLRINLSPSELGQFLLKNCPADKKFELKNSSWLDNLKEMVWILYFRLPLRKP